MLRWTRPLGFWFRSLFEGRKSASRKRSLRRLSLRIDALEERRMLAVAPELIGDFGSTNQVDGFSLLQVGNTIFYSGSDSALTPGSGIELWKTDVNTFQPTLVSAIRTGGDSNPRNFTNVNGTLFFTAFDDAIERRLWKSDGTCAGTTMVANVNPFGNDNPYDLTNVNGTLYFTAIGGNIGRELWKSDGTASGTVLVKDIRPGLNTNSYISGVTNVNGTLFFTADNDGSNTKKLWKTDGTCAGTVMVRDLQTFAAGNPTTLVNINGTVFFSNDVSGFNSAELWKSDGTSAGTVVVKDIRPGSYGSNPGGFANLNGTLYFSANDGVNGTELWKSNGTSAGTVLVKDIATGLYNGYPQYLTNVNGTLYFRAQTTTDRELWKTDGTNAGTVLVKNINLSGESNVYPLTNVNGTLYFGANDGVNGIELWKSDGTSAGTTLVKNIDPSGNASPGFLTNANGTLVFVANDGVHGSQLYKTDGTAAGTTAIRSSFSADPANFIEAGGTTFFTQNDGVRGSELWKTNGTASGTVIVKDINPGSGGSTSINPSYANVNGTLFFVATDGTNGFELWKSNGSATGTVMVRNINPAGNAYPSSLTNVNGTLYFRATDGASGYELWKSDGTSAGTVVVKDINPGSGSSDPRDLLNLGGTLYFSASDGVNGAELWKSNGTGAGTVLVKDINAGAGSSSPRALTNVNGTLFFSAGLQGGTSDVELWKSDGTCAGTVLVKDINTTSPTANGYPLELTNFNGTLFFRANNGSAVNGRELWKSDGTSAGTVMVKDINPGTADSAVRQFAIVNSTLYFQAVDGVNGRELWKTDGTCAGTLLVKDINPSGGSFPAALVNVNGTLYFRANNNTTGYELWSSDGTSDGTVLVKDINPGASNSSSSLYAQLANINGTLYFAANDGVVGNELWKISPSTSVVGSTLTITGTSGDDSLVVQFTSATAFVVILNGQGQGYDTSTVNTIIFDGAAGNDTLQVIDAGFGANTATLSQAGATVGRAAYTFSASNTEYKYLFGDAADSVTFNDTAGADQLYQLPQYTLMLDGVLSYYNQVISFGTVTSTGTTGADILLVFGTAGNDNYVATPTSSILTSAGLSLTGINYDSVYAFGLGGTDSATFTGGAGNEVFYGLGGYGYSVINNDIFLQYLVGFAQTIVNAGTGTDNAIFYDFAGNDIFTVSPSSGVMAGAGYSDRANGFDQYFAYASGGGVDTANLDGTIGNDFFTGNALTASLFQVGVYAIQAIGFEQVNVNLSSTSGTDQAELIDGPGADFLNANGNFAELTYAATGNKIRVSAFDTVFAKNQNGVANTRSVTNPTFQLIFEGNWG